MLNRQQSRKVVHRSISDVSVGKSMWKNVASVVSNLRSGYNNASVYNQRSSKENLVIGKKPHSKGIMYLFFRNFIGCRSKIKAEKKMNCRVLKTIHIIIESKQKLLSNVPAANSHPNYFGISPSLKKFISNWLCNVVRRLEGFA